MENLKHTKTIMGDVHTLFHMSPNDYWERNFLWRMRYEFTSHNPKVEGYEEKELYWIPTKITLNRRKVVLKANK